MVKVLIVDDSAFVRRSLTTILEKDPNIKVIAAATNGKEAIELAKKHDPDVITMDIDMPVMDGLTALQHIMESTPCPVIMVSSLTNEGAEETLRALELGALDFMPKLGSSSLPDIAKLEKELSAKVTALAKRKSFMRLMHSRNQTLTRRPTAPPASAATTTKPTARATSSFSTPTTTLAARPAPAAMLRANFDAVAIGVSTGGPPAVQKVLFALPANFPVPILIAQHMPAAFTGPFAKRLDTQCAITVKEAEGSERLRPGTAYVCPGGKHLRIESRAGLLFATVTEDPKDALYKPSANVLLETMGNALGKKALCVILTGMGNDGLEGAKILKAKGGKAIAQSEASCVVYGMPKAIVDANLADEIVDIDNMGSAILACFTR